MTPRVTATVLFVDASGSVRLFATRGDAAATTIVTAAMARMERAMASHGGRVVKRMGDGVRAVFENAAPRIRQISGWP